MAQSEATITPSNSSETIEERLLRALLAAGYGSSPDTINPAMLDIRYQHQQVGEQEEQGRQPQQPQQPQQHEQQEQQDQREQREGHQKQQEQQQQQEQQGLQPAAAQQQQQQQAQARQNHLRAVRLQQHRRFEHNQRQRRQRLQEAQQQQQQEQPLLRKSGKPRLNPERKVSDLVAGACKTCRKSRTKCQRNPHGGPCHLCVKRGRECDLNVTDKRTSAAEISDFHADVAYSCMRISRRWSITSALGNGQKRQAAAICRRILQDLPNPDEAYASIAAHREAASALSNGDQEILSWDLIRDAQAFLDLCRREPQLLSRIRASRREFVEAAAALEEQLEQLIKSGCANQEMWEAVP